MNIERLREQKSQIQNRMMEIKSELGIRPDWNIKKPLPRFILNQPLYKTLKMLIEDAREIDLMIRGYYKENNIISPSKAQQKQKGFCKYVQDQYPAIWHEFLKKREKPKQSKNWTKS